MLSPYADELRGKFDEYLAFTFTTKTQLGSVTKIPAFGPLARNQTCYSANLGVLPTQLKGLEFHNFVTIIYWPPSSSCLHSGQIRLALLHISYSYYEFAHRKFFLSISVSSKGPLLEWSKEYFLHFTCTLRKFESIYVFSLNCFIIL